MLNSSSLKSDSVVCRHPSTCESPLFDELIVTQSETDVYIRLHGTGKDLWGMLDGAKSVRQLCSEVAQRYEVEGVALDAEVLEFLESMERLGFVRVSS
jgi:hypothetical protein